MRTHSTIDSPVGELILVADGETLVGLYFPGRERGDLGERVADAHPVASAQLAEYFAGKRRSFDVPIALAGTDFQQLVWETLTRIPYGETWTYGRLAAAIGRPQASRAVGMANNQNPISIIVPCHRVVGADGQLVGYGGGLENKEFLLALERGSGGLFP
ncbi:MAG: methylated-DNA--[protein]-cysteine S-methyltransferase [Propionibacteriaceae bacterium]|nr:methylated-DNA--[protein]-cysteine S-methyltransferase [Propionibacteriaceae bacterium]